MLISNTQPVETFISKINAELSLSTKAWTRIADVFAAAETEFGFASPAFKSVLKATDFKLPTASKLIKIARSERLKSHADRFEKVKAWTVLYGVSALDEEQFQRLMDSLPEGTVVTTAMVNKAKAAPKKADSYQTVLTVRLDTNALRCGSIEGLETLLDLIDQLEKLEPHIRVDTTKFLSKAEHWDADQTWKEYGKVLRRKFVQAIQSYKKHSSEWQSYLRGPKGRKKPMLGPYSDEQEAMAALKGSPREAFEALGSDTFDEDRFLSEAGQAVANKMEQHAKRVSASSAPTLEKGNF